MMPRKTLLNGLCLVFIICLLTLASLTRIALAGSIRTMIVSERNPATVVLFFGKTTVLSFHQKPEKVVAGSPEKLHIDFLGKDLTLSPLATNPGNLIVYTKTKRFVILLKLGSDSRYDDVVAIEEPRSGIRTLNLGRDAYRVESLRLEYLPDAHARSSRKAVALSKSIVGSLSADERELTSEDLFESLSDPQRFRCQYCRTILNRSTVRLACAKRFLSTLHCRASNGDLFLKRDGTSP